MSWTWQHALEEWYRALEQSQIHWDLHHGLALLKASRAPQAVLCGLENCVGSTAVMEQT